MELLAWLYSGRGQTICNNSVRAISSAFRDIRDDADTKADYERRISPMEMRELTSFDLVIVILIFAAYFLPTFIAFLRQHRNMLAIFLLNLLLGWTALGWVGSFIWSAAK